MAIEGKKREETNGKRIGIGLFSVLGVNLDNTKLKELGFYVKEEDLDKDREFITSKDVEGEMVDSVRIEFACKEVDGESLRKFNFFVENSNRDNKDHNNFQWINNQGQTSWAADKASLQDWFAKGKDPRPCKKGEAEFMEFMTKCMAIDFKDGGTLSYDLSKFFKGNFKELQDDLKTDYLVDVVVACTIKEKEVTDPETEEVSTVEYENFYNKAFASKGTFKVLKNKKEFTETDVEKILDKVQANKGKKGKDKAFVSSLENLIYNMANPEYPCKDITYFGLLKDYVKTESIEEEKSVSSDY